MQNRIEDLEYRLAQAENTISELRRLVLPGDGRGTTLRAPLRVIDEEGNLVLEVYEQREPPFHNELRLFNSAGRKVISVGSQLGGGFLTIRNDAGQLLCYLSIESEGARLLIHNNEEKGGVALFGQEQGGGINITSRNSIIGLWTTDEGSEIEIWRKEPQEPVVSLSVNAAGDTVTVRGADRTVSFSRP